MTVTLSAARTYAEAIHTVHAAELHGAAPLHSTAGQIKPDAVTVEYAWRTQLRHTDWSLPSITVAGAWVTPAGDPDPKKSLAPRTPVRLDTDNAPGWAASFGRFAFPRFVPFDVSGAPAQPAEPPLYDGEVPLGDITVHTEITYTVYDIEVTGADPLRVPSHIPGRGDRWMRPERVGMDYRLPLRHERREPDGQWGWQPAALGEWHLRDLSVTGPWVTETGRPVPHAVGTARWPGSDRPGWLAELIARHTPDPTTMPLRLH
jgi:hypothetical protein